MSDWIDVAPADEFGPGQGRLVDADDVLIAVFNLDGEYYAIEDKCTHDGSPFLGCGLEPEELLEGEELICPRHGARFCLRTGDALTPPAYEPAATFPVRIEDGMVQIRDDR
ncbi:MAG: non-heme iron oxygenase ferredoxin subunit [Gammaproteobacteria bacterium]|jgi:3-phenylpropionate/trans-cinnamate dioxygenase ferredoxin subunit